MKNKTKNVLVSEYGFCSCDFVLHSELDSLISDSVQNAKCTDHIRIEKKKKFD